MSAAEHTTDHWDHKDEWRRHGKDLRMAVADVPTLPQRLRALAGEPWPFPVPDPDFGMTGNVMREAAQRIEELEAQLAGVYSGIPPTNAHQPADGARTAATHGGQS